jgi:uncharacterized coiled-coil DUF342 family protein
VSQLHEEIKELSENHGEYECYNLLPKCLNYIEQLEKENEQLKQDIIDSKVIGFEVHKAIILKQSRTIEQLKQQIEKQDYELVLEKVQYEEIQKSFQWAHQCIKKMKCCCNCEYGNNYHENIPCGDCVEMRTKWKLTE